MSDRGRGWRPFGRRSGSGPVEPDEDAIDPEAAVPCVPCEQQKALRPFTLNLPASELISDDLVPTLRAGVADAIVGNEVVLFDPGTSQSTLLNPSAALIWASIDGQATVASIIDDLVAETGVERGTIDDDVRATVARFELAGVVEPTPMPDDRPATGPDGAAVADAATESADRDAAQRREAALLEQAAWLSGPGPRWCGALGVEVRVEDPEVAAMLDVALGALAPAPEATCTVSVLTSESDGVRHHRVVSGTELRATPSTAVGAVQAVVAELNDLAATRTRGHLLLHAGAVARGDDVVVIAGASGRGKSTLTAALVRDGFDYLTDELVAIDPTELVARAYAKPIDLDQASHDLLEIEPIVPDVTARKAMVFADRLGRPRADGGRVALLVLLDDPADPTDERGELSAARSLVELLANTFAATFDPASGVHDPLGALALVITTVPVLHLDRRPLDEAARLVAERLDAAIAGRDRLA